MFLTELSPVLQELTKQPIAFMGGFVSGILNLDVAEDPLKSWLNQQGIATYKPSEDDTKGGPKSISID